MKCFLCNSRILKLDLVVWDFDDSKEYRLVRCISCKAINTIPRPSKKNLQKKYSFYREKAKGTRFNFILDSVIAFWHSRRIKIIRGLVPQKGKILDVGCGRGVELRIFKKLGWQVKGTELSRNYFEDIPVLPYEIWQLKDPVQSYDVITFLHSLEHLRFPGRALKAADRLLKPGAILAIAVPNYDSLERKIFGLNWFHLDIPRHLSHFNLKFFKLWAKRNGYVIVKSNSIAPEYDFYSILQGFLNFLPFFQKNLLYIILLKRRKKFFLQKMIFLIQIPFMILFSVLWIIVPILWAIRESGTIELFLMKTKRN